MAGFRPYKSYNFTDKDHVIDRMRTAYADAKAKDPRLSYKVISERSGVSVSAMYGWFDGQTKRPQVASATAFLRVIGYDLALVSPSGEVISLTRHHLPGAETNVVKFATKR